MSRRNLDHVSSTQASLAHSYTSLGGEGHQKRKSPIDHLHFNDQINNRTKYKECNKWESESLARVLEHTLL